MVFPAKITSFRSLFNQADRCADRFLQSFCRPRCDHEGTNLTGDHRKTASCSRHVPPDRRVQRQYVGLKAILLMTAGTSEIFRAGGNILSFARPRKPSGPRLLYRSIFRQFAGVMRIIRILLNGCRQLFHYCRGLFTAAACCSAMRRSSQPA